MVKVTNRFAEAYHNSSPNQAQDEKVRRKDTVINGINYGRQWSEGDQAHYDLYLKSLEFDNNMDMLNYVNEYNSPQAQAQRMRAAGLNPDLQGINADTASPIQTQAPSAPNGESHSDTVVKYANIAQQFFELIPQAISTFQSIRGGFQQLDMNQLQLLNTRDSIAQREIGKQLTVDDLNRVDAIPRLSYQHLPKRQQRSIEKHVSSYLDDFRSRDLAKNFVYRARAGAETARQDYLNLLGKHGFSFNDEAFVTVIKEFNKVLDNSRKAEADYNSSYYAKRDGSQKADVENKVDSKRGKEADNDIFVDLLAKANNLIDSDTNKDKIAGTIMYILLGLMKSKAGGIIQ